MITDFTPAQGDVIDVSGILHGSSTLLSDYLRIRRSGGDAFLDVSAAGTKTFTGLSIRLEPTLQPETSPACTTRAISRAVRSACRRA